MQKELPEGFAEQMEAAGLASSYDTSGWCFIEATITAGVKMGKRRLDLKERTAKAMGAAGGRRAAPECMLDGACSSPYGSACSIMSVSSASTCVYTCHAHAIHVRRCTCVYTCMGCMFERRARAR